MKSKLVNLYNLLVVGNQKALVGFAAPVVLGVLASLFGITKDMTVGDAVQLTLAGVVTGVSVWFKKNK